MSDPLWPHGLQPTRLLCLWSFPGKNTGVVAISFSRGSSWPRDQIHIVCVSCIGSRFFTTLPPGKKPLALRCRCSVAQLCPTLCNPMDCSTPGFPVHHQPPDSTLTHVRCIGNTIQPFHPLLSPSLPTFNLSQNQGLFQWVSSSPEYWSFSFSSLWACLT